MVLSNVAGFPRIGDSRELKFATESYWKGDLSLEDLERTAKEIRSKNWTFLREAGIDLIPSNDFSYYDQVLDAVSMAGVVPDRYAHRGGPVDLDTYFAMARGRQEGGVDVIAMEMIKWFDTNYHYIVPELGPRTRFSLSSEKPVAEYREAKEQGFETIPVLVGPLTFLIEGKAAEGVHEEFDRILLLDALLPIYEEILTKLGQAGAQWVQLDEPSFVEDRTENELNALSSAYERLCAVSGRPKILVKTYFDHAGEAFPRLCELPIEGVGFDFVDGGTTSQALVVAPEKVRQEWYAPKGLKDKTLFAGVVDGRNIWINDLDSSLALLQQLNGEAGELVVSTTCSLIHVPIDLDADPDIDDELHSWMAFARQKVREVVTLTRGLNENRKTIASELETNRAALERRQTSPRTRNPQVRERVSTLPDGIEKRVSEYTKRRDLQQAAMPLPKFPTTTIGSYPQTPEIRHERARFNRKEIRQEQYVEEMRREIERVVRFQEEAGLDVLVHGEAERNDMIQYFAELLEGCAFTKNGWVQSYGSRYTRPPIIYGDVSRPNPMTIEWITYAQSLTDRPMKGMLTGPVTMLEWSFVRDDQPLSETCKQMALSIRDEVEDLEKAGIKVIQVDEPAIREGLPLRMERWQEYLDWAVFCFRLSTSVVRDETQIQTHLCYSEFGDIIEAVDALDADVALMWCARAGMRLLDDLQSYGYTREVGPGIYDIHSPRVPSVEEMAEEIRLSIKVLEPDQIWVNPDCGLKTRTWDEAGPSVKNMVEAAKIVREELAKQEKKG